MNAPTYSPSKKRPRTKGKILPVREAIANQDIDDMLWKMMDELWIRHSKHISCKNTAVLLGKTMDHLCGRKPPQAQTDEAMLAKFLGIEEKVLVQAAAPPAPIVPLSNIDDYNIFEDK